MLLIFQLRAREELLRNLGWMQVYTTGNYNVFIISLKEPKWHCELEHIASICVPQNESINI